MDVVPSQLLASENAEDPASTKVHRPMGISCVHCMVNLR
jgi:hypothetical protein